jgi:hypothetical protein
MRRFFNGNERGTGHYNDDIPISRQIIFAETPIEKTMKHIGSGEIFQVQHAANGTKGSRPHAGKSDLRRHMGHPIRI